MKKALLILLSVFMVMTMLVSCNMDANEKFDGVGNVSFASGTKALSSQISDGQAGNYYWAYAAVKKDNGGTTGKTEEYTLAKSEYVTKNGDGTWKKGLEGINTFSVGKWEFTLWAFDTAVTDANKTEDKAIFKGTATATVAASTTNHVPVNVYPYSTGTAGKIQINVSKDSAFAAASVLKYKIDNGSWTPLTENLTVDPATAGSHTVYVGVFENSDATTSIVESSIAITVYRGLTTLVTGTVDDITGGVKFDAHPYEIQSDGSWKCAVCEGHETLQGTDAAYITVLDANGQPGEIIPLTTNVTDRAVGTNGAKVTVDGNKITYTGSASGQTVVIRTNSDSTIFTVDAENDTIAHYGEAGFLNIIKVNTASYHEHGYIPQAQIAQGRIVNEIYKKDEAGVQGLLLVATTQNSFSEIIVGAAQSAKLPSLDRTDVSIPDGGVLVVKVEEGVKATATSYTTSNEDYVYLYKSGIKEQVLTSKKEVSNGTITGNIGETVQGTAKEGSDTVIFTVGTAAIGNADSQTAAEEIANIAKRGSNGRPMKADGLTEMTEEEVKNIDSVEDIKISTSKTKVNENALFAGGSGTKNNPYLIATEEHFANINQVSVKGTSYDYKFMDDITYTSNDSINYLNGVIDGNGHSLTLTGDTTFLFAVGASGGELKNIDIIQANSDHIFSGILYDNGYNMLDNTVSLGFLTKFTNVNVYAADEDAFYYSSMGYRAGVFTNMVSTNIYFKDCNNYMNICDDSQASVGVFIGNYVYPISGYGFTVLMDNCWNYGNITGNDIGVLIGNSNNKNIVLTDSTKVTSYNPDSLVKLYVNNCGNKGNIEAGSGCYPINLIPAGNHGTQKWIDLNASLINSGKFTTGAMNVGNLHLEAKALDGKRIVIEPNDSVDQYDVIIRVGVGYDDGSEYAIIRQTVSKSDLQSAYIKLVESFLREKDYKEETGNDYASIDTDELTDTLGHNYKIVEVNNRYVAVFTDEALVSDRSEGAIVTHLGRNPEILVNAMDSKGTFLGTVYYTPEELIGN